MFVGDRMQGSSRVVCFRPGGSTAEAGERIKGWSSWFHGPRDLETIFYGIMVRNNGQKHTVYAEQTYSHRCRAGDVLSRCGGWFESVADLSERNKLVMSDTINSSSSQHLGHIQSPFNVGICTGPDSRFENTGLSLECPSP